jgi:hypothetical protein
MQQNIYGKNKEYLSYSAIDLWRHSPAQYRRRYYEGYKTPDTIYTAFGRSVHEYIEHGRITIEDFPQDRFASEVKIEQSIDGVDMLAYIDILNTDTLVFADTKTSKHEWNAVRVQKLDQLPIYSLIIQEHYGEVASNCAVVWVETAMREQPAVKIDGATRPPSLERTGRIEVLWRTIDQDERNRWRTIISTVADEIRSDYQEYSKTI